MITKNILLKNFQKKCPSSLKKKLKIFLKKEDSAIINSLKLDYRYSYTRQMVKKYKNNFSILRIIGMGGSILGTKAIFSFLKKRIKKKTIFYDNLVPIVKPGKEKKTLNLIVSKSGNTLETISNTNILIKKNQKNIFITENSKNCLRLLANKMKAEVIDHNNFIGGRYSVLSEVGMLPASLVGLNDKKFKQFNKLISNKSYINALINNVYNITFFLKKKKFNSVIINYDNFSSDLFE